MIRWDSDAMVQVYTGDGKGKTTAAIGLAIRSLGAGHAVYMMQFMKSLAYSEQKLLQKFSPQLVLRTTGKPCFLAEEGMLSAEQIEAFGDGVVIFPPGKPPEDYRKLIEAGFEQAKAASVSGQYELVILDEINVALAFHLLTRQQVEPLLAEFAGDIGRELILTGRKAPDWMLEQADLVTEMREIRHYYQQGIEARRGIEN